jgi:hypothetical protein
MKRINDDDNSAGVVSDHFSLLDAPRGLPETYTGDEQ